LLSRKLSRLALARLMSSRQTGVARPTISEGTVMLQLK
jgi:hypothetical protein